MRVLPNIEAIIETVIRTHPEDCIFGPNPVQLAVRHFENDATDRSRIDVLEEAIKAQEIYCPHEGIDRR